MQFLKYNSVYRKGLPQAEVKKGAGVGGVEVRDMKPLVDLERLYRF